MLLRTLFRIALGRRLPVTNGELTIPGPAAPITIRRDKWGIPHLDAESDADAWFGLGFCHAQDRAFQLETLLRLVRGTLSEVVGGSGLPIDRMSRRIGFRRSADEQLPVLDTDIRAAVGAYVNGVNAGLTHGLSALPHEFTLLRATPTAWEPADVLGYLKLQSFFLPSNWDVELARLRALRADGPGAVRALEPGYPAWHPTTVGQNTTAIDRLSEDLALFQRLAPPGGGSNNWVIAGSRTLSGKPLLANDPHLAPNIPAPWYLAHLRTPNWSVAGATFAGAPAFPCGHNGYAAWGITAGLTDNTDLCLEAVGADGVVVGSRIVREVIRVKGRPDVIEDVPITPRGPVISPILPGVNEAVSLRAVWLQPRPLRGFFDAMLARDFDSFRKSFTAWPVMPLNLVYADAGGTIGWQLVGEVPRRAAAHGMVPLPAYAPEAAWDGFVPFEEMPFAVNPADGFLATANNKPDANGVFLGDDFLDGYRVAVIREELSRHPVGWTVGDCLKLQRNVRSKPWEELRDIVLSLPVADADVQLGLDLLREWDGVVAADSPGAAVFELFVAELSVRIAKAKAPTRWAALIGGGDERGPLTHNLFSDRRVGHLVSLLRTQLDGWFARPWSEELATVLGGVVRFLRKKYGPGPTWWHWGDVRPVLFDHAILGKQRILKGLFNRGPYPCGGDQNTVSQAGCRPLTPTDPTHNLANLRTAFDTADWSNSRFVLAGGQSGNPLSPHYDDQLALWLRGDAVPMPWTTEEVLRAATATLRLLPGEQGS